MKHRKRTCTRQVRAHHPTARPLHLGIGALVVAALLALACGIVGQSGPAAQPAQAAAQRNVPPRVIQAQRFLARRGFSARRAPGSRGARPAAAQPTQTGPAAANWEPLGPAQVLSPNYGLVTGRIASLALDSSGTLLLAGTTGGGVWLAQNPGMADISNLTFLPLTDQLGALSGAIDASISIGAVSIQPLASGIPVILAGTGDPNDALDSYYGAGLLRSTDGGNTWNLIAHTSDVSAGLDTVEHGFAGEGFAGFAWSNTNPQVAIAAVSHAYESQIVSAGVAALSYAGLYYAVSDDPSGPFATWHLAEIADDSQNVVQGPLSPWAGTDGNPVTSVVWNPVRGIFIAAVRAHGYYQSPDGRTWMRIATQPGAGLAATKCPTISSGIGSKGCHILRGSLAVNPVTGDTFAWTVDLDNQDQGLWQDVCNLNGTSCANQTLAFTRQWSTAALESNVPDQGALTIPEGDYNLALAAVPSGQDTLLMAGANDLWKCSLAMGCQWRNTTNSTTCMSAQVGEYQHAIAWSPADNLQVFVGNDSGLWRSLDAIGETGSQCSPSDASHWQNLNGAIGSLAEVEDLSGVPTTPYTLLAGLGANGVAGIKSAAGPVAPWLQVLGGEGGPVAIDPSNSDNWYANNGEGVSIHRCAQSGECASADFGLQPAVTNADTGNDGSFMTAPAPFLVDPADPSQLLIATCRLWRGPASGIGWSPANQVVPIIGGGADCGSGPQVRSLAAAPVQGGGEIVYAGTYGPLDGGGNMGGHILSATMDPGGTWSGWNDLTQNPVAGGLAGFNPYNFDISSIAIDPHDPTGQTIYVTIQGMNSRTLGFQILYQSADGGAHWTPLTSSLPYAPANAVVVDPVDANTVYVATDAGVYSTQQVNTCGNLGVSCWTPYGNGLPLAPVTSLMVTQPTASQNVLVAGTYGRGVWQIPLLSAGQQLTSATVAPDSLAFATQAEYTTSAAQAVTLTNTGGIALVLTAPAITGDFVVSDPNQCIGTAINTNQGCAVEVTFSPMALGSRSGVLTLQGNIATGNITVPLSGTGAAPPQVTLSPQSINFGPVENGTQSTAQQVTAANHGGMPAGVSSAAVSGPFVLSGNSCGSAIAAGGQCSFSIEFSPLATGAAAGTLTVVDDAGTQTVQLTGTGTAPPTDPLGVTSLDFPSTVVGVPSAPLTVTLTNGGGNLLTGIAVSVSGPYQQNNNCGGQLAAGQSCTINVVLIPTASGQQNGTLSVVDAIHTQAVALQGTGLTPPAFTVNPSSLNFSQTVQGTTSAPLTVTVTNSGGVPMANIAFQITGSGSASFATGTSTCGPALDPQASCTVQVTFAPTVVGAVSATLITTTTTRGPNNAAVDATVLLNGNGGDAGTILPQPSQISFPSTGLGQTSAASAVTLTNQSAVRAFVNLTMNASAGFEVTGNQCGSSLAAGGNCVVQVAFAPLTEGPQTGTLTISSSTLAAPIVVPLSGTGFDYTPTVTGSSSQTVSSGTTATYALQIAPVAGVPASFTFNCGSLPQYASCSFNPATLAVGANGTGTEAVQIATSQTTGSASLPGGFGGPASAVLTCGALLLLPALRRRRRPWIVLILLAVPALFGGLGCSGSGGGGGGTVQVNNTPAGTYTIAVGVTSSGVKHSVTVTLIVD